MRQSAWRLKMRGVGWALASFVAVPASAQPVRPPAVVDPMTLDVAGVKLGMTPDEAMAALRQFDANFKITKLYGSNGAATFSIGGGDTSNMPASQRLTDYLTGLSAVDEGTIKPETKCSRPTDWTSCQTFVHDDVETITIGFSPVPGKERVIGILREKQFHKEPKPAFTTLFSSVTAKYSFEPTYQRKLFNDIVAGWQFDPQKRLMSGATAKSRRAVEAEGKLPRTVHPGDGITLSVAISQPSSTPTAGALYLSLFDADALYKSVEQSNTTYAALKAKADGAAIERANNGAAQTKF